VRFIGIQLPFADEFGFVGCLGVERKKEKPRGQDR
jgi:hypothetical protein